MECDGWVIHGNPGVFADAVRAHLEAAEAENGLLLGILDSLAINPPDLPPLLVEWRSGGRTACVALQRDSHLVVSRGEDVPWDRLAARLREIGRSIPSVAGPPREAERMAEAWAEAQDPGQRRTAFLRMDQRIYRLTRVEEPPPVPGRLRAAEEGDVEGLVGWFHDFDREAAPWEAPSRERIRENTRRRIVSQTMFLWEAEGVPVAAAALTRPTPKGITVNSVYTPPEHRRRGYATALVAAVSAEGLRRGKEFCVLYTDLANPTSNSIYQKVGYRPLCDSRLYGFR